MGYRLLGGILAFIVGIFHVALMLALFFGLYLGYVEPVQTPDPGGRIADSAIHSAKESVSVVERVGKWFQAEVASDTHPTQRVTNAAIILGKVFIYYPAWAGAGAGGACGGVMGDLAWHIMHKGEQPQPTEHAQANFDT